MSPFYRKEGENWKELKSPTDIHLSPDERSLVQIIPQSDPEQVTVSIDGDVIVRDEDGDVIYPGQYNILVNRRDIFIESTVTKKRKAVIYSREPIREK